MDDATADRLRGVFRRINPFMVAMWRLGLGRWVNVWLAGSGRIFVLGHRTTYRESAVDAPQLRDRRW